MQQKTKTEQFKEKAIAIHGDKRYDYSEVEYVNAHTPVKIMCTKHNYIFSQSPSNHLAGKGCKYCGFERVGKKNSERMKGVKQTAPRKKNRLVYGIGINDADAIVRDGGTQITSYHVWADILYRCHTAKGHVDCPAYTDCYICKEWKRYSNFKQWFDENYIEGYQLDKDILVKGNRVYGPNTCCFVPNDINMLLAKLRKKRSCPTGVSYRGDCDRFVAQISIGNKNKYLGLHKTVEEAFAAYKEAKEAYIRALATKHYAQGHLAYNVYEALMNREINMDD